MASQFRNVISREAGAKFPPEKNRYHLYIAHLCPWAQRTVIASKIKGLDSYIPVSVVHWERDDKGWRFATEAELAERAPGDDSAGTRDHVYGSSRISELYYKALPEYEGRFTVPVLWDKKNETIVNNESGDILRFLNSEFNDILDPEHAKVDLYPEELRAQIDDLNAWIHEHISTGVGKIAFAALEEALKKAEENLFVHLDKVEGVLRGNREKNADAKFLTGTQLTEADISLYVTIVRFDPVFIKLGKEKWKSIREDFPYIHDWLRFLYWKVPGFKETTDFDHIKKGTKKFVKNVHEKGFEQDILPL